MTRSEPARSVQGVVLAGGDSTRFESGEKAFASYREELLIERVVGTLQAVTSMALLLFVRDHAQMTAIEDRLEAEQIEFGIDDEAFEGPLAGIVGAAEQSTAEWLFVTACDMPLLDPDIVSWILERETSAEAVVPQTDDGREPLHALYRRTAILGARERLPAAAGLKALLDALDSVEYVDGEMGPPDFERSLTNVNTRDALDELDESLE